MRKDEIVKHFEPIDFNIIEQLADGSLLDIIKNKKVCEIKYNTVVITTLGRIRDHKISHSWKFVIIDECLSVQNKDALQTEEAWRQVICSKYGVLMLSATFFRSRFDKLFYMIKMLRCGLPEEKAYLDTILSECIVCHIPETSRKWITNINEFHLDNEMAVNYNNILSNSKELYSDKIYSLLSKYLYDNYDYIKAFSDIIENLSVDKKALIYARSKHEADEIATKINNVSRYPIDDKNYNKHIVLSYAEGTYGLNDLVDYNTIISRPPYPDHLIQMKGRLDRPNQNSNILFMEYLLVKNTIEEAWMTRLEMANMFHNNYIMPLAEFYKMATNYNI